MFRQDERLGTWLEEQKLEPQDPAHLDRFGRSLAASEGRVLIGARFDDDNGTSSGSAYVFGFDAASSQWIEQQKLLASDGQGGDQFGRSVALDGDLAIVGAWAANDNSGAAYVFHQNTEGVWSERCKLLPEPNDWTQFFGQAVALDGKRAIIAAKGEDVQTARSTSSISVSALQTLMLMASSTPPICRR